MNVGRQIALSVSLVNCIDVLLEQSARFYCVSRSELEGDTAICDCVAQAAISITEKNASARMVIGLSGRVRSMLARPSSTCELAENFLERIHSAR